MIVAWTAVVLGIVALTDGLVIAFGEDGPKAGASKSNIITIDIKAPSKRPALPVAAQAGTAEGATAFVRFWFDGLNYSLAHGDTDLLAHYSNAGCPLCSGYLLAISKWKSQRAQVVGGYTVPASLAIGPFSTTDPVSFAVVYLTSPATLRQPDGSLASYPGGRTRGGLSVLYANGRWQMTNVVLDSRTPQETP